MRKSAEKCMTKEKKKAEKKSTFKKLKKEVKRDYFNNTNCYYYSFTNFSWNSN